MSNILFQTAAEAAAIAGDTDEVWKSCKWCGCYSHRHELKTQSLTGIAGDPRLKGMIVCKQCSNECQVIKQKIIRQEDPLEDNRTFKGIARLMRG